MTDKPRSGREKKWKAEAAPMRGKRGNRTDGIHVGSRIKNKFYDIEFFHEEDWWEVGCYEYFSGIDEQLLARISGYTNHPTGDCFSEESTCPTR